MIIGAGIGELWILGCGLMKIFLDTNVFYNDWFTKSANFRFFFHYANNKDHEILISAVVLQEAQNIRNRDLAAAVTALHKQLSVVERLNGQPIADFAKEFSTAPFDLLSVLKERVERIVVIDYAAIPHSEVVARALKARRPFLEGEKGYRDTLI